MRKSVVVIPNYNGMQYLPGCLSSLRAQTDTDFTVVVADNGSTDGSAEYIRTHFPEVKVGALRRNTGFCHAVNTAIRATKSRYVIFLNNDTVCDPDFIRQMHRGMEKDARRFSCAAKIVQMDHPELMDDAGDFYCALGWAFARGHGKMADMYSREQKIFASCGAAAIFRRELLEETGLLDERHFAYLEDIDLGYRAQILGYENWFLPEALVRHAGSATTGSAYNEFKVRHASRNSVYLIAKNMPLWQIALNAPLLLAGFTVKAVFFARRGFGKTYLRGLLTGLRMCRPEDRFTGRGSAASFLRIEGQLLASCVRRLVS